VKIIPDSSFFICFLDDLDCHIPLDDRHRFLILLTGAFSFRIVQAVDEEARLYRAPPEVVRHIHRVIIPPPDPGMDPSLELLRPLLGKGEREVIACAYIHHKKEDRDFFFIIDDGLARDLVKRILPALISHMKGTVGFLGFCAIQKVLEKNETINLLTIIGRSKFRVDRSTISTVIAEVQSRCS